MEELDYSKLNPDNLIKFQSELESAKAELIKLEESKKEENSKKEQSDLSKEQETYSNTMDSESNSQVESKYTDQEQEALKQGWNPDYEGPNKKSAEQFLKDGSFFKKIDSQNKKIDDLSNTIKALVEHNKRLETAKYEEGYQKALSERQQAIEDGNVAAFNTAEAKLHEQLKFKQQLDQIPSMDDEQKEMLSKFKEKHDSWFTKPDKESQEMTKLAVAYDQYNLQQGLSQKDSIKEVENIIRLKYPHRFENPKQEKAPTVIKQIPIKSIGVDLKSKLSEQQRWMFDQASRVDKSLKLESYINQLKSIGAIKDE